ncbi:MAG: helicase-related protein [Fermentimonas sp.]|nr:helicase-related protein [Fermentimonas sp.]
MQIFDNINTIVKDDLIKTIKNNSRISIASTCFSIYAYEELKEQLQNISELRFIFTSPTFVKEKQQKEKREFFIPQLNRERSLYGTEFEIKLRNELSQKAIAKECTEWIKQKVKFKSNVTNELMGGFINIESDEQLTYFPINGFTTVDLGCEKGNNLFNLVSKIEAPHSEQYLRIFNEIWQDSKKLADVTEQVIENISNVYKENSPDFIYFITLYNIFNEFLEDISEDILPNSATGFKESEIWNKLYNFQQDAVLSIINKLEKYNGCILADSVGLGKTYTALAVIKYYENRNKSVLVLCPKKLNDNWVTFRSNLTNNPIAKDRLRYDVLYHTDLSRDSGMSNGLPLDRINWGNYDLVVIDESHNFRNGGQTYGNDEEKKENRYLRLLNKVIRAGVKTKVLMLSATPVNNRFFDLRNQIALAYEGESEKIDELLDTHKSIDDIFRNAQAAFNKWSKYDSNKRTTENLLNLLDFDFFEVLDSVTIARSRKHIEKYYNTEAIGKFPERLKPISFRPSLTKKNGAINYNEIYDLLVQLNLSIYTPSLYVFPSKIEKYESRYGRDMGNVFFKQSDREKGIQRLMNINLLKRLESSVHSFNLTVTKIKNLIDNAIELVVNQKDSAIKFEDWVSDVDLELDDQNTDLFVGKKVQISLKDIDTLSWLADLRQDSETLHQLLFFVNDITPEHDFKLQTLLKTLDNKIENPINGDNKKVIMFTAFSDTAEYLFNNVSKHLKSQYNINTALITGSVDGLTTIPRLKNDMNTVLTCFSPISKQRDLLLNGKYKEDIDILIATDCISEGQNLQDCDYLINYDIHWNPVRIIQRFGRIDRIGSKNDVIQLVNFWPDLSLDDYINLKARVETRMKISVMTSTGDDNPISEEEKGDLEYRKKQLQRLMEEVVDLEDMTNSISIMDLGLNEFRLDLLDYMKNNHDVEHAPFGLHAVVNSKGSDTPKGVFFVLKNISKSINIDKQNQLHPFYMVYISNEEEIICNHISPKKTLDLMRYLCKGNSDPILHLCKEFNKETQDGRKMGNYSKLLESAIASIINVKEEKDIISFFNDVETTSVINKISGLSDFELICFLVVK